MSNTTILFVPGASGLPEFYDKIANAIRSHGHSIHVVHKPSVGESAGKGREGVLPTMYDDAAFIAAEITKLADQGDDVIVACHSYGGTPGSQSIKGLSKTSRTKAGKPGGVVRIAYMTCLVPKLGETAGAVLAGAPKENAINMQPNVSVEAIMIVPRH